MDYATKLSPELLAWHERTKREAERLGITTDELVTRHAEYSKEDDE